MTALRVFLASLGVAAVATGAVHASSGTNYADQWGVPTEPTWGVSIQQQSDALVINLIVYGDDGRPMWLVASALRQQEASGHDVFRGALYAASGPYFAATFDPAMVSPRKVGDVTFDASGANDATLSYSVDGATTVKNVVRQTWGYENLAGHYDAVWKLDCDGSYLYPYDWSFTDMIVTHDSDNSVTIWVALWKTWYDVGHSFRGTYTQSGRLGEIRGDLVAPDTGSLTIARIEKTSTGFSGSVTGTLSNSCHVTIGRLVAVRSP